MFTSNNSLPIYNNRIELLGSGFFSYVYSHPQLQEKVIVYSVCPVKRILSKGFIHDLLPRYEFIKREGHFSIYLAEKLYPASSEASKKAYSLFKECDLYLLSLFGKYKRYMVTDFQSHNIMVNKEGKIVFNDLFYFNKLAYSLADKKRIKPSLDYLVSLV